MGSVVALACVLAAASLRGAPGAPTAIHGGNEAPTCRLPTVVAFRTEDAKCSGVLVHPEVVVTAAHCVVAGASKIHFGEHFDPEAFGVETTDCFAHPDYLASGSPSDDIGVCRLARPVPGLPRIPLLAGCADQALRAGTTTIVAGFGIPADGEAFGVKRYAITALADDLRRDDTFHAGDASVDGCLGDSGGPAIVRVADGTWRVAGVLTSAPECGDGPGLYAAVHPRLAWLEEVSGVDLTPCHDADGRWAGDPGCDAAADPLASTGTWDADCPAPLAAVAPQCAIASSTTGGAENTGAASNDTEVGTDELEPAHDGCGCGSPSSHQGPWLFACFLLARRRRGAPHALGGSPS